MEPGSFTGKDPFRGIPPFPVPVARDRERGIKEKDTKSNDVVYLFWRGYYGEGEASPASPARGAACLAAELMRRGEWFAGWPLRVREPFGERLFRFAFSNPASGPGGTFEPVSLRSLYTRERVWWRFFALLPASLLGFHNPRDLAREEETAPCPLRRHPFRSVMADRVTIISPRDP